MLHSHNYIGLLCSCRWCQFSLRGVIMSYFELFWSKFVLHLGVTL